MNITGPMPLLRFASEKPRKDYQSPFEGMPKFSDKNDPPLPPEPRFPLLKKAALVAGLFGVALGGVWHFGKWQRDPVYIDGRYFNPRHTDKPDIVVSRVYTLPQSKKPVLVDLVLFAEPVPKDKPTPFDMMPPEAFVHGIRKIVRWEHYQEILPKMEAALARTEAQFGPAFTTDQLKSVLRQPWTDGRGIKYDSLWRKPIAHTTIDGFAYTLSLENIETGPYQGFPPGLTP